MLCQTFSHSIFGISGHFLITYLESMKFEVCFFKHFFILFLEWMDIFILHIWNLWNLKFALSNIFLFYFWNEWTFSYYIFGIYGIKSLLCLSNIFFMLALWRQCIDVWSIYSSPISNSTISDFQNGVGDDEDYEDYEIIYNANYI